MRMFRKFILLTIVSVLFLLTAQARSILGNIVPDSSCFNNFANDDPYLKTCDSLYKISFGSKASKYELVNFDFARDSVPLYLDSTYQARIKAMDIKSPFEFRYNADVRNYIYLYTVRNPGLIARALTIKELYFPLFEQMLDKYQVPIELKYLAIVESALNAQACSRVGALGLWQFMPATGKMYGLNISSKIDDRMNPYKATEAACRHFVDLYKVYHDWNLVLAAYNAGQGNINKAIKRSGDSVYDYWSVRPFMPRETQGYVPAFIAVNYAMTYYFAHNIQPRSLNTIPYYLTDTVYITQELSFKQLSNWLDVPEETIRLLNPQYKKGIIPEAHNGSSNVLCLPYHKIGEFIANEQKILSGIQRNRNSEAISSN